MVQTIPVTGSIAGRIGKGLGQGLSEQIPKEVDRYRLSSGLKQLGKQDFSGKSPLEQMAAIYSIPGITPQMAEQAQQQIQNRNFFGSQPAGAGTPNQPNAPAGAAAPAVPAQPSAQQQAQRNDVQDQVPVLNEKSSNYGIPLDREQIEAKAREVYSQNPNRFKGYQDYIDYAQQQDDKRVVREHAFEERQADADNKFNTGVQEILQKQGNNIYSDLPGEISRNLKNKMKNRVDAGMSPARAADETLKEVLPLVRARNDIAQATGFFNRMGIKPEETRRKIENGRDIYKNAGALRVFRDDLVAEGMNDGFANYIAYPVKDHKEVNNYLSSVPKVKPKNIVGGTLEAGELGKSYKKEKSETQIAEEVGKLINNQDSILSIALSLKGRGYDPEAFVAEIGNLSRNGQLELNDRQKDELTKDARLRPNLMDAYLFAKMGLDPLEAR